MSNILNDESTIEIVKEIDDKLFLFKTKSVYEAHPAQELDSKNQYRDTNNTYQKILDIGSRSPCIARVILQFEPIIKSSIVDEIMQKRLIKNIWEMNKELATCYMSVKSLREDINKLALECSDIVKNNIGKEIISVLPQVNDLENRVNIFYNSGQKFLIDTFKIFEILFGMQINTGKEAHFKSHCHWLTKHFGETSPLSQIIEQDLNWIILLTASRNAIENPTKRQTLKIKNFILTHDNKFVFPSWSYDLSAKNLGEANNLNLLDDLDAFLDNMLSFFEEIMLQSIQLKLNENNNTSLSLYKFEEKDIDVNCPIQYGIKYKFQS